MTHPVRIHTSRLDPCVRWGADRGGRGYFFGTGKNEKICERKSSRTYTQQRLDSADHWSPVLVIFFFFWFESPHTYFAYCNVRISENPNLYRAHVHTPHLTLRLGISNHDFGHVGGKSLRTIRVFTEWQSRLPG